MFDIPASPRSALHPQIAARDKFAQRLFDEKRIALREVMQRGCECVDSRRVHTEVLCQQDTHIIASQWCKSDVSRNAECTQRTECEAQLVAQRLVALVPAGDEQHAMCLQLPAKEVQQLNR